MALYHIEGRADMFEIYKNGEKISRCMYWDEGAYPFIMTDKDVYIGRESNTHSDVIVSLIGMTETELMERMDNAVKSDNYEEMENVRSLWEKASKLIEDGKHVNGRIFTKPNSKIPFNFSIISFWGGDKAKEMDDKLIKKLLSKFNVSENNLLIAVFNNGNEGELIPYAEWSGSVSKMDDRQKQMYAIHLMNSRDKRKATDGWMRIVNRKIGKKLTNSKGEEMPMAKYRSLFPENKQYKINKQMKKHIKLTENDLKHIVRKSINKVLRENTDPTAELNQVYDDLDKMFSRAFKIEKTQDYRAAMQFVIDFIEWMRI